MSSARISQLGKKRIPWISDFEIGIVLDLGDQA